MTLLTVYRLDSETSAKYTLDLIILIPFYQVWAEIKCTVVAIRYERAHKPVLSSFGIGGNRRQELTVLRYIL